MAEDSKGIKGKRYNNNKVRWRNVPLFLFNKGRSIWRA
jgi:hypothetical protein